MPDYIKEIIGMIYITHKSTYAELANRYGYSEVQLKRLVNKEILNAKKGSVTI